MTQRAPLRASAKPTWRVAPTFLGVALGVAFASASADAQIPRMFRKGPYVQDLSSSAVSIRFELETKGPASVELSHDNEPPIVVMDRDESSFHAVRVDKLKPATRYSYIVRALGATSARGEVQTAPADDSRAPMSFLIYGDNRTDPDAHAAVVRAMKQSPTDFLVHTGDFVASGGSASDWQAFFDIEAPLLRDRCLFACVGNHELFEDSAAANYVRFFTPSPAGGTTRLFGSMRWSNARFFFLNAFDDWSGGEQRAWLNDELARADSEPGLEWRFAVVHHGAWSAGPHGSSPKLTSAGIPALLAAHKIDLLVSGHDHIYERGESNGMRYLVSGGGGAPVYRNSKALSSTRKLEATHHFVEVTVNDKGVQLAAKRADGSLIEKCGFAKARGWDCDPSASPPASGPLPPSPQARPAPEAPAAPAPSGRCGCRAVGGGRDGAAALGLVACAVIFFRARRQRG